ncbi:MAG: substrate-binding domain-containing protein [Oscillospiraceae bacterium]|nr:substrate-binding domain-containing protein [Oscillospiraceae bacterium]
MRTKDLRVVVALLILMVVAVVAVIPVMAAGQSVVTGQSAADGQRSAYDSINQPLDRPEGWSRIVGQPLFSLGEPRLVSEADSVKLYEIPYGSYPVIDGSTVGVPMALEFAREHLDLPDADLTSFVFFSTTHQAYVNLIGRKPAAAPIIPALSGAMERRPVELVIGTAPSTEERAMAEAAGIKLIINTLCYDAFVFITHKDNPIQSLTAQQIRDIYAGRVINWKELGGADADILAYQRNPNSGSQTAMDELVMRGEPLDGAVYWYISGGMEGLVRAVGDYENALSSIGYTYKYYLDTLYQDSNIKMIAVDGVAPTDENIVSGAYPFTAEYVAVIRDGEQDGPAGRFLEWMLGSEGMACVRQAGYLTAEEARYD